MYAECIREAVLKQLTGLKSRAGYFLSKKIPHVDNKRIGSKTVLFARALSLEAAGGNAAPMPGAAARHQGEVCTIEHSEFRRPR